MGEFQAKVSGGVVTALERRKRLGSLPFSEKLKIPEKLRERDRQIAASGLRKKEVHRTVEQPREGRDSSD